MAFIRQTWTLCEKTLRIVLFRNFLGTLIRAFLAPIIFMFFIAYAKNFFVPPSDFGVGHPMALRSLSDAVAASAGGRDTVVFINNGHTGGDISQIITQLQKPIEAQGKTVHILDSEDTLSTVCQSSIRGVSPCFAAVTFMSSPKEGSGGIWNYTIRADGSLGGRIYVNSNDNDAQIYTLPLQHAIDNEIGKLNGAGLPDNVQQYSYTTQTSKERQKSITRMYMGALIDILAVAYFIGIVGICYQLTGEMAKERELGMSQLIEAMMPNKRRWTPQAARILSLHISFDILYLPSWVIMGAIIGGFNYKNSSIGLPIGYLIISGLALSSWSIAFASIFRKAQLSGITVTIVSIILAIIIQVIPPVSTAAAAVLSLIFPPMNFTLFIIYMAYWQKHDLAAKLSEAAPDAPWRLPGYLFFVFCAIQIIVYPIVGALIERSLFGTASKARQLRYADTTSPETVKITGLSKIYPPNWFRRVIASRFKKDAYQTVHAVDGVDISVLRGQIMILLGANGSGKSTTLDMLAGLQKPTNGTIEMDATGGIGLCPQKNVLWDELTVLEHVEIFNKLKADKVDSKFTMKELVLSCDLEQKVNAKTVTLSGGQKRKCQLAMMLTGGSTLCMLDEVSSGLDPLSRRKIWDIVLAERGKRSMILTTHFLDEADLLSDDITILSRGRRVAHGSAVELKHKLGGGYRVCIYHENKKPLPEALESVPKQVYHDQTVYRLGDSAAAAHFIAELERAGVNDYQVNGPTIEDVFLKLAEEVKAELEEDQISTPSTSIDRTDSDENGVGHAGEKNVNHSSGKGIRLVAGKNLSFLGQTWVLFRKRLTILNRNRWPYVVALLLPIIAAGLVTLFLKNFKALTCSPNDQQSKGDVSSLSEILGPLINIPVGPPGAVPAKALNAANPDVNVTFNEVKTLSAFEDYVSTNYSSDKLGGFFLGDSPTFAWRGNYEMYFAIATQNLFDNSLLDIPVVTNFQPFDVPWAPGSGKSLQFILYFGLAMSAAVGFYALYPNMERLRNVRALHYSNGVKAAPLWAAYASFDFLIFLVVSAVTVIIFVGASNIWYGPGYLFVIFALYGLSAILMSYVVSLFTTSQLATFAFAAGGQCVFFLLYFVTYMCIITYIPAADIDRDVNIATFTMTLFFPAANILRAMLLTFNEFSLLCRNQEVAPYLGAWDVYGSCITYLVIQSIALFTFLVAWDSGWKPGFLTRNKHRTPDDEEIEDVDSEVFKESKRVDNSNDELRVLHAHKRFGSNFAVQDVSFGVPKGEVFALLGPNGAGKSTTIGLIRGDTRPSDKSSDIIIEGTSIVSHRAAARNNLGVCPQFDAMDQMTAIEHLRFYARARGVANIEHNVDQVIEAVGLEPFKTRMAAKLSGGNKRKLSLGIALMGDPSVVILDEPSSGMDAASKRVMWRTLSSISSGRSMVLTTHSMEEADALADRAGIMAKRMLAVGTSDQLRKKHGDAYHVHVVHKDAPYTAEKDIEAIREFVHANFPGATTEDRVFHGQLRFSVPNDRSLHRNIEKSTKDDGKEGVSASITTELAEENYSPSSNGISALFRQLEANKEKLGFEYYSVSQATLDQVFLNIVTKHNVMEENYNRTHSPKKTKAKKIAKAFRSLAFWPL